MSATGILIVLLTLLAPALGGAKELWAQAVIFIGCGLLMLISPAKRSGGVVMNVVVVGLLLIGAAAFLPVEWFPFRAWREMVMQNLSISLPATRTPQPWLTLEAWLLFVGGVVWGYYVLSHHWRGEARAQALAIYVVGIIALAAALIYAFFAKQHIPFWPEAPHYGFFPNRNQTGNVLALAGIVLCGLGFHDIQRKRASAYVWLAALVVICSALVINYSRAGILLFFGGAVVMLGLALVLSRSNRGSAIGFAGVLLVLTLFLLFGGATLERFRPTGEIVLSQNIRMRLQLDTIELAQTSPLLGVGLGNFKDLFPLVRDRSVAQNLAVHPESDWLWLAAEMGWLAPLLLLIALGIWLTRCLPFKRGSNRVVRIACTVAVLAFAIHGIADVSGHAIGAVWPALLLASIALSPKKEFQPVRWMAPLFRLAGVALVSVGCWWMASTLGVETPAPTSAKLERLREKLEEAHTAGDFDRTIDLASAALEISPLDWTLYFYRASAQSQRSFATAEARRDFRMARFLEPNWATLPYREGVLWLTLGEIELTFDAWAEALRRADDRAAELYRQMLSLVGRAPGLRDTMRVLAEPHKGAVLIFLQQATPFEFDIELRRLLEDDPHLREFLEPELAQIFEKWWSKGDRQWLIEKLIEEPRWQKAGWPWLARHFADQKDFRSAYLLADKFAAKPATPELIPGRPVEQLERTFYRDQKNIANGIALFHAQLARQDYDAALTTLRMLTKMDAAPEYLHYSEAVLWARREEWEKAWQALERFFDARRAREEKGRKA